MVVISVVADRYEINLELKGYFVIFISFFKDFIYLFFERGHGREKERERNIHVRERNIDQVPLTCAPVGDLAHNPGMCPVQE